MTTAFIDDIDALLPQTQCRRCGYDGCRPYAEAMANGEADIDKCLPGGIDTLLELAQIFDKDPAPYQVAMQEKMKPACTVVVREKECIGCTKCIQACPVDAIVGAAKLMHAVIEDHCTGCELCIEPCPVDCIDIVLQPEPGLPQKKQQAARAKERFEKRNKRLASLANRKVKKHQQAKQLQASREETVQSRKAAMAAIMARKMKRT